MHSVYTLEPHVFNMYFIVILSSAPTSTKCYGLTKILYASLMHLLRPTLPDPSHTLVLKSLQSTSIDRNSWPRVGYTQLHI
jgi:hypothetical protein